MGSASYGSASDSLYSVDVLLQQPHFPHPRSVGGGGVGGGGVGNDGGANSLVGNAIARNIAHGSSSPAAMQSLSGITYSLALIRYCAGRIRRMIEKIPKDTSKT